MAGLARLARHALQPTVLVPVVPVTRPEVPAVERLLTLLALGARLRSGQLAAERQAVPVGLALSLLRVAVRGAALCGCVRRLRTDAAARASGPRPLRQEFFPEVIQVPDAVLMQRLRLQAPGRCRGSSRVVLKAAPGIGDKRRVLLEALRNPIFEA